MLPAVVIVVTNRSTTQSTNDTAIFLVLNLCAFSGAKFCAHSSLSGAELCAHDRNSHCGRDGRLHSEYSRIRSSTLEYVEILVMNFVLMIVLLLVLNFVLMIVRFLVLHLVLMMVLVSSNLKLQP